MLPQSRHRNRTEILLIHGRKTNNRSPRTQAWMPAYEALRQDWNSLIEDARQAGIPLFYAKGYMDIVARVQTIAENPDIPTKSRAPLIQVLENHQHYLSTRKQILDYPGEVERHMDGRAALRDVATDRENELTGVSAYPDWRQEAERLTAAGEAILSGKETYGVHLERLVTARTLMTRALSALREAIRVDDKELAEWQARELRRLQNRHWVGPRFASDDGARAGYGTGHVQWRRACAGGTLRARPRHRLLRRRAGLSKSAAGCDLRAAGPGARGETEVGLEPPGGSCRGRGCPCHLHGRLRASEQGAGQGLPEHAPGSRR